MIPNEEIPRFHKQVTNIISGDKVVSSCLLVGLDKMMILMNWETDPEYRRKGFGAECLQKAMEVWRRSKYPILMAGALEGNVPAKVFRKLGWQEIKASGNDLIMYLVK